MKLNKQDILNALKTITVPGEGENMVDSGAVTNVMTFADEVIVDITIKNPSLQAKKKAEALAKQAKEDFLKKNETLTGRRIDSPTGMAMIFTHEGDGVKPTAAQNVNIDCAGYFEDGTLFWTTWKDVAKKNGKYDEDFT